jgi:hypothetical protein
MWLNWTGGIVLWFHQVQPLLSCSRLEVTCCVICTLSVDSFNQRPMRQAHQVHGVQLKFFADAGRHDFPSQLNLDKGLASKILEWNDLRAMVVNGVCVALWQDNNTVLFLTTIHDVRELVLCNRRKPKKSSTNAASTRKPFEDLEHRKLLPIPEMVDDYNQFMGGVDIADQLRSNYPTHQRSRRNWLPLWFWALDTTVSNCHIINKFFYSQNNHKSFRIHLANLLVESGWISLHPLAIASPPSYRSHISINTTLPDPSLRYYGQHTEFYDRKQRRECWYCRFKKIHGDLKNPLTARKRSQVLAEAAISDTGVWCTLCNLPLCKQQNCFFDFHTV